MKTPVRILIIVLVAFAAIAAFALKGKKASQGVPSDASSSTTLSAAESQPAGTAMNAKLPRLLDLGAGKCIPCKMMKPILDDLKQNYSQVFITEFIDVWENREAGKQFGIEAIPTQIFYDSEGKELFRHQGFYGKEDILGKWKELGISLSAPAKS